MKETVVVLGASSKPDRYSHRAMRLLMQHGHTPIPVHPKEKEILDRQVYASLSELDVAVDTVTLYVRPELLREQLDDLVRLQPRRVIMNPGTEDRSVADELEERDIKVLEACTLVLLNTGQFEND